MIVFIKSILILITSFFSSIIVNKLLIKDEHRKTIGQEINKYLYVEHQNKKMTPTLGGIGILFGVIIASLINIQSYSNIKFLLCLGIYLSYFVIGLIDDLIKVKLKDYHGLSALIRFLLEILIAIIFIFIVSKSFPNFDYLQISSKLGLKMGKYAILIIPIFLVGFSNSMNLSDGLDGLSSSLYIIIIMPFIYFSFYSQEYDIGFLLIASFGATLGFIYFNLYPAKLFMGDSGSLALGGLIASSAILLHKEILLIIAGGIFIFETITVILQVICFKSTGKRLFLMAPFHHHLELKGFKEYQIVMFFYVIGFVLAFICLLMGVCL